MWARQERTTSQTQLNLLIYSTANESTSGATLAGCSSSHSSWFVTQVRQLVWQSIRHDWFWLAARGELGVMVPVVKNGGFLPWLQMIHTNMNTGGHFRGESVPTVSVWCHFHPSNIRPSGTLTGPHKLTAGDTNTQHISLFKIFHCSFKTSSLQQIP